jgi:predicted nucleotidyltransferase
MPIPERLKPILAELKRGLQEIYGDRLRAVVLFGSQARGEATEDSDVDVAVVLDDFENAIDEVDRMDAAFWPPSLAHDLLLTAVPIRERDWRQSDRLLLSNIRRDGVPV